MQFKCLHERVVILEIRIADTPFVPTAQGQSGAARGSFHCVRVTLGFMDRPNLTRTLHTCESRAYRSDASNVLRQRYLLQHHLRHD